MLGKYTPVFSLVRATAISPSSSSEDRPLTVLSHTHIHTLSLRSRVKRPSFDESARLTPSDPRFNQLSLFKSAGRDTTDRFTAARRRSPLPPSPRAHVARDGEHVVLSLDRIEFSPFLTGPVLAASLSIREANRPDRRGCSFDVRVTSTARRINYH